MSAIVLSAVISPDVTLDVVPAALLEAVGVVALRSGLHDGPLPLFSGLHRTARWLAEQVVQLAGGAGRAMRSSV